MYQGPKKDKLQQDIDNLKEDIKRLSERESWESVQRLYVELRNLTRFRNLTVLELTSTPNTDPLFPTDPRHAGNMTMSVLDIINIVNRATVPRRRHPMD